MEKVSVIIPTKNRPQLLKRALKSVINQTYKNLEIIVVDDGSNCKNENLKAIAELDSQADIRYHYNSISKGGGASRNLGVKLSCGEFFCFLDDDDEYFKNKIQDLASILSSSDFDAVFGKVIMKTKGGAQYAFQYPRNFEPLRNIKLRNYIHTNATLIKRETFPEISFDEHLKRYQDTQYHISLAFKKKIGFVDIDVACWDLSEEICRITQNKNASAKKQIELIFQLIESLRTRAGIPESILGSFYLSIIKLMYDHRLYFEMIKLSRKMIPHTPFLLDCARNILSHRWQLVTPSDSR